MRALPRSGPGPFHWATAVALTLVLAACSGGDTLVVETEQVTSGEVTEVVSAPARVDAAARQDVAATVAGSVAALEVDDGDEVSAGQVILRLTSEQVDTAREQADAARTAAAGGGGIAVGGGGGGSATRSTTTSAVADLDDAAAPRLEEAREQADEIEDGDQRLALHDAIDSVETAYRATRSALLAAGEAVALQQDESARALTRALNEALGQVAAPQRAQAEVAAAAADRQADGLVLSAPFDGVVRFGEAAAAEGSVLPADLPPELAGAAGALDGLSGAAGGGTLRVGAPVSPGQTLFTVYDLSERYVDASVDEVDAPQVREGQRAVVLVDALPDTELEGIVERIDVEASSTEAGGVGYPTRIRLVGSTDGPGELDALRVGMTASAEIVTTTVDDAALVVPSRALIRRAGATVVFVVRDGVAREVPLAVSALGEDRAAVAGELETGEQVIVTGYETLEDGSEVAVQERT